MSKWKKKINGKNIICQKTPEFRASSAPLKEKMDSAPRNIKTREFKNNFSYISMTFRLLSIQIISFSH